MADDPLLPEPRSQSFLMRMELIPQVNPDTTPPAEVIARSAQIRGVKPDELMATMRQRAQPKEHPTGVPEDPQQQTPATDK